MLEAKGGTLYTRFMFPRLFIPLILTFFAVSAFAQSNIEWVRLGAGEGELELTAPSQGLVLHEQEESRLALDLPDVWFAISLDKRGNGKLYLKNIRSDKKERVTVESRKIGDTQVKVQTYQRDKSYSVAVNVAGDKYFYRVSVGAPDESNRSLRRFLGSIKISGQLVFPELGSPTHAAAIGDLMPIEKLRMDQMIFDSLKVADSSPEDAKFARVDDIEEEFDQEFSRRLFLVKKPKAIYTDEARRNGKQGMIRARVEFRSDGTIGDVTIDPSLDKGLARNVAKAISMIKFVPAEKNGASVTIFRNVHYSFAIY